MRILKEVNKHNLNVVAIQKLGKIILIFTPDSIYVYGKSKEVDKWMKRGKNECK